jgi:hypothetical protein
VVENIKAVRFIIVVDDFEDNDIVDKAEGYVMK